MGIFKKKTLFFILSALAVILGAIAKLTTPETVTSPVETTQFLEVIFADVDQGNATLLKTPANETILVDGGEEDVYESHLLPLLKEHGIEKIDYALVSHYHSDHMGGIQKLLRDDMIKKLYLPDYEDSDHSKDNIVKDAETVNTDVFFLSAGDSLATACEKLSVRVLHPVKGGSDGSNFHNNSSLVLSISYGGDTFLLTGDIESRAEKEIITTADVECDVLQVAHHGSSTSSSKKFIQAADPTYAVISAGADNRYGHPHNETLELLENEDIRTYRTDIDGHIIFEVADDGIRNISFSKT